MRFAVTGEWTRNRMLMLVLWGFLGFVALLWVTNLLLFHDAMGFTPTGVAAHYLGDEASFRPPRSFRSLLEVSHFHLMAMGLWILTLAHLVMFVPVASRWRTTLIVLSFSSALVNEASGWAIRYAHPAFAWVKLGAFLGLQGSMAAIMVLVAGAMLRGAPSGYQDGAEKVLPGERASMLPSRSCGP